MDTILSGVRFYGLFVAACAGALALFLGAKAAAEKKSAKEKTAASLEDSSDAEN